MLLLLAMQPVIDCAPCRSGTRPSSTDHEPGDQQESERARGGEARIDRSEAVEGPPQEEHLHYRQGPRRDRDHVEQRMEHEGGAGSGRIDGVQRGRSGEEHEGHRARTEPDDGGPEQVGERLPVGVPSGGGGLGIAGRRIHAGGSRRRKRAPRVSRARRPSSPWGEWGGRGRRGAGHDVVSRWGGGHRRGPGTTSHRGRQRVTAERAEARADGRKTSAPWTGRRGHRWRTGPASINSTFLRRPGRRPPITDGGGSGRVTRRRAGYPRRRGPLRGRRP